MNSKGLDYFALVVTIIGAINWGLIGFFKFDLVAFLFGQMSWISQNCLCSSRFMRIIFN